MLRKFARARVCVCTIRDRGTHLHGAVTRDGRISSVARLIIVSGVRRMLDLNSTFFQPSVYAWGEGGSRHTRPTRVVACPVGPSRRTVGTNPKNEYYRHLCHGTRAGTTGFQRFFGPNHGFLQNACLQS